MMQRRHYELIAKALHGAGNVENAIAQLCVAFNQDNPRFSADRFRIACGDMQPPVKAPKVRKPRPNAESKAEYKALVKAGKAIAT